MDKNLGARLGIGTYETCTHILPRRERLLAHPQLSAGFFMGLAIALPMWRLSPQTRITGDWEGQQHWKASVVLGNEERP